MTRKLPWRRSMYSSLPKASSGIFPPPVESRVAVTAYEDLGGLDGLGIVDDGQFRARHLFQKALQLLGRIARRRRGVLGDHDTGPLATPLSTATNGPLGALLNVAHPVRTAHDTAVRIRSNGFGATACPSQLKRENGSHPTSRRPLWQKKPLAAIALDGTSRSTGWSSPIARRPLLLHLVLDALFHFLAPRFAILVAATRPVPPGLQLLRAKLVQGFPAAAQEDVGVVAALVLPAESVDWRPDLDDLMGSPPAPE